MNPFALLCMFSAWTRSEAVVTEGAVPQASYAGQKVPKKVDLGMAIDVYLQLKNEQKVQVDPLVRDHQAQVAAILADSSMKPKKKDALIAAKRKQLVAALRLLLNGAQMGRLETLLDHIRPDGTISIAVKVPPQDQVSVGYLTYFPTDSSARSIFGNVLSSYRIELRDFSISPTHQLSIAFDLDNLSLLHDGNNLFLLEPEIRMEYRSPINKRLLAFVSLGIGPTYVDYSFDTPSGSHDAAKIVGAQSTFGVGVRYNRFELSAEYKLMTPPAGINLNGIQIAATWAAARF